MRAQNLPIYKNVLGRVRERHFLFSFVWCFEKVFRLHLSILAVHIVKFRPLKEPIRILLLFLK